jgi:hypothetical protein
MLTETVAGRTYDYSHNVGRGSATGMGFNNPVALAMGPDGVVYVVNRGSESISNVSWDRTGVGQRIGKVSLGSRTGEEEYLGEFSRYGSEEGQLIWPAGIAADPQGHLYVTDEGSTGCRYSTRRATFYVVGARFKAVIASPMGRPASPLTPTARCS